MEEIKPPFIDILSQPETIEASISDEKLNQTETSDSPAILNNDDSLVQSPSIGSFSTIQDTYDNVSESNTGDDKLSDLNVKIDSPEKNLDTLETYITFRITTQVSRKEFANNEYVVKRRYNDFLWLYHKLIECHPFCIVPPLPAKHTLLGQLDRYSKDFILLRMKSLNIFIKRICHHPILSCNEHFRIFLTAQQKEFADYKRKKNVNIIALSQPSSSSSSSSTSSLTLSQSTLKNRHIEFDKMKTYLSILMEKVIGIEKISNRINKERMDLITELNCLPSIFNNWSSSEPTLANILRNIANAIEKSTSAQCELVRSYNDVMGNPIKELVQYIDIVQDILKKRDSCQLVYELSIDELNKRQTEKDKLVAISHELPQHPTNTFAIWKSSNCDNKIEKLNAQIPQLLKKIEINQDNLEMANECLRSDLDGWQKDKQKYLKQILLDFVNKHIDYYTNSVKVWEHVANEAIKDNDNRKNGNVPK